MMASSSSRASSTAASASLQHNRDGEESNCHSSPHHGPLLPPSRSDSNDGRTNKPKNPSSRAPWTMIATLLIGLGFALAHHFMNAALNGKPVNSVKLSQQWSGRFGTALAFLVKMFFTISVGSAFVQHQWRRFHRQSFRIDEIDTLTNILTNPLGFLTSTVIYRQWVLFLVAAVSWAIPLAAVIAPASLVVNPSPLDTTISMNVVQPYYGLDNFGPRSAEPEQANTVATVDAVYRLTFATASAGQPVTLPSEYLNQSYTLTFEGPAVKCSSPSADEIAKYTKMAWHGGGSQRIDYFAYVPSIYELKVNGSADPLLLGYDTFLDTSSPNASEIRVITNPQLGYQSNYIRVDVNGGETLSVPPVNVSICQLYNASYHIDLNFRYPNQTSKISISRWLNPVAARGMSEGAPLPLAYIAYGSMMQAFGRLLVGYSNYDQYEGGGIPIYTTQNIMDINWADGVAVRSGLESFFMNMTLSLLGDIGISNNLTQPATVTGTYITWPITYSYKAFDLLLAYGLAFLFSLICVAIGLRAYFLNHASYQNQFSSFLRAAHDDELRAMLDSTSDGSDPLPKQQAKLRIMMGGVEDKEEG